MNRYLLAYALTAAAFLVIDMIWLGVVAKKFYAERLAGLLLERPNLTAAAVFYLVYVVGVIIFAVGPALRDGTWLTALGYGALFGFFAYATYDMTNYATLRNWPLSVSVVDTLWGTALTGTSAAIGYFGVRLLGGD